MSTVWRQVARQAEGDDYAAAYAERFRQNAARGDDVHGEATYVDTLVAPPARILDAGCGTGRIAIRLHELGYVVVGCDVDETMLAQAQAEAPDLDWRLADLESLDLGETFEVVLVAGNVIPLLDPGTLDAVCHRLVSHLASDGRLVVGLGLSADSLPEGSPVVALDELDAALAETGLVVGSRWATWDRQPFDGGDYVVAEYVRARG